MRDRSHLIGLISHPLSNLPLAQMHNYVCEKLSLDYLYLPLSVSEQALEDGIAQIRAEFFGVNVMSPHRENALYLVDELTDEATNTGFVGLIVNKDGALVGHNLDGIAFMMTLKESVGFDPKGKTVLICGAGGMAGSIALALAQAKAKKIYFVNRTRTNANTICSNLYRVLDGVRVDTGRHLNSVLKDCDLVVNASPVFSDRVRDLPKGKIVLDARCSGNKDLAELARKSDCKYFDGSSMLINQAALSLAAWTGIGAPYRLMNEAYLQAINQKEVSCPAKIT